MHPWALSVLANAIETATTNWNKQVMIATHSPVLISQFEPAQILAVELDKTGQTKMTRVSEIEDIQDLLEDYATGSLYMAEMIAPQSESHSIPSGLRVDKSFPQVPPVALHIQPLRG